MKKIYSTLFLAALSVSALAQHEGNVVKAKFRGTINKNELVATGLRVPTDTLGIGLTSTAQNTQPVFAPSNSIYTFFYTGGGYIFGNNISANDFYEVAQGYQFSGSASIEGVAFLSCGKYHGPGHTAATSINVRAYNFSPTGGLFFNPGPPASTSPVPGPTTVAASVAYAVDMVDSAFGTLNFATFASPVTITGEFAVGAEFNSLYAVGDTVGFSADAPGDAASLDYAFHHPTGAGWYVTNSIFGAGPGDLDVNVAFFPIIRDVTGINGEAAFFKGMKMSQNFPNPVNTTTSLNYELEKASKNVTMKVYDMSGAVVGTYELGAQNAGVHTFNYDSAKIQSGTYLFMLTSDTGTLTMKFTVEK